MAASIGTLRLWDNVLELTKKSQDKGSDPLIWAVHLSSQLNSAGVSLPSPELANLLVSHICWDNNNPISWKFLEKALISNIVPPLLVLALLSTRVIPKRHTQPAAFRLYMELLKRHAFEFKSHVESSNYEVIMDSINNILHLSQIFGIKVTDTGSLLLEYIVSTVWQLVEAALEDEGLLELTGDRKFKWNVSQDMELDGSGSYDIKRNEYQQIMQSRNTVMAVELIGLFLQNKVTSKILSLARRNMPTHWRSFIQDIEVLAVNSQSLRNSKIMTPEILLQLISDDCKIGSEGKQVNYLQEFNMIMSSSGGISHKVSGSSLWISIDLVLEDAMDGSQVDTTSAVEIITSVVKALQALNGTSWHDCFLGLWMAALRLVQRERDPIEGPMPRLDTRLCMLLSIIPLVVSDLIEDEENGPENNIHYQTTQNNNEIRRRDLVSSLQILGDYQSLLTPPQSTIPAANQAAAKALMFISGINVGNNAYFDFDLVNLKDMANDAAGSLHHLIVETCIARNLLDTSAYFWPGYVTGHVNQIPHGMPGQVPGWSMFMKGAPLTPVMVNALVSEPASSLAEVEKVFEIAVKGSDDEKLAAATILCGASLIRGWNVQEHTIYFITRLLSPPPPANYSGNDSHLVSYAPMLNILLVGIAPIDCVQIFSLHGLVPQLVGSLMPICEVFGSCVPNISWTLTTGEEISAHAVFSNAFSLLLKLWRFNHPPIEYSVGDVPPVGSQLTPEYILLMRNSLLVCSGGNIDRNRRRLSEVVKTSGPDPIFVDSFPKLKAWYRQHQACLVSTLSGLVRSPVHQIVDSLLNMMFRKINKNQPMDFVSESSSSSGLGTDDVSVSLRPVLPAWDILEAVPFVVDAALTACTHGRLSPRELCTGLKDLTDFLPASLAIIVSYFSAEVSRGVWKPVSMNGTDWPSPAANLSTVEEHIKNILAATNVNVPRLFAGISSPFTLPLPLAAFLTLTITYKLDTASQRFLHLAGPALESLAAGCPWPCTPIVASLWTQKAKKWSDSLLFSSSRTVFLHDNHAVAQLLKSCFMVTLGLNNSLVSAHGGVGALLGHGFGSSLYGEMSPVAPGFLYLRVYRSIRDIMFLREDIISILMQCVKDIASNGKTPTGKNETKYGQASVAASLTKVKLAAQLGASILWISGGQGLVQSLINETLPSWFISAHQAESGSGGSVLTLSGYALGYFTVFCGAFAWGVDSSMSASKWRRRFLGSHMEFLASALNGKITLGCDPVTWRSYVTGFVNLMAGCMPNWVVEVDLEVLKRLSKGLVQWNEEELAVKLLEAGGVNAVGAAAELICRSDS